MPRHRSHSRLAVIKTATAMVLATAAMSWAGASPGAQAATSPAMNWLQLGPSTGSPPPRSAASMVYDAATASTLLFGGFHGGFLNDTWTWGAGAWTPLNPPASPSAREDASLAYDAKTHAVVLFGGVGPSGDLGDTWTWNGTTWTQSTAVGPSARSGSSMTYDAKTHAVVLFGGVGPSGDLGDTWTWNGTTWTQSTAVGPSARSDGSMTYDAKTHAVVLFGGRGARGAVGDTWTGDGTTWTQELAASPTARYGAALVYDGTIGDLVLFGGTDGVVNDNDTWLWNGTYWVSSLTSTHPVARSQTTVAYDAGAHNLVLFAGTDGVSDFADTWSFVTSATAPRGVRATSNANAESVVTWSAPTSDGGSAITGYVVAATDMTTPTNDVPTCSTVGTTSCTFTGLTNGDHYVFRVDATTAVGAGTLASSNVAIPATPPGEPTITSVVTSQGGVTLSWTAPSSTGGIPIVSYRAIARPGGAFCHVAGTANGCLITGLRDGSRLTFSVFATNAAGNGPPSSPSASVVVRVAPGAPIITSARALRGRVLLRWRWPSSNGGSRVTGYNVYVGPVSGAEATSPLNARPIHGLTFSFRGRKGYSTFIEIRAVNAIGVGSPSRQVMVFTP